jgi:dTDP-4-dehydrorhamnose reductase
MSRLLVTGGARFIGSSFVHHVVDHTDHHVTVLDNLTYAGNRESLAGVPEHRTTIVYGDVADDGRLTFTSELARAIRYLIETRAPYGVYNVTGSGPVTSWADVARRTFAVAGHDPDRVSGESTDEYLASAVGPVARRPRNSALDVTKIEPTGYSPSTPTRC